jgi:hypothetical protein
MMLRRTAQGLGVVVAGLALALAPLSAASATSHKAKHHKTTHHSKKKSTKTKEASKPSSSACSFLDDQNGGAKLAATMEQAIASGNFASAKQTLLTLFDTIGKDGSAAENVMRSAPANVQTAFKTMINLDSQIKTALQNSTSFQQMEQSFATIGQNPTLQSATTTVGNYADSLCGG